MFGIGLGELIIILIIALVIFGPSKLPSVGASLGKAMRGFKKAINDTNPGDVKTPVEKNATDASGNKEG